MVRLAPLLLLAACTSVPASPIKTEPIRKPVEAPDPFYVPVFSAPDHVAIKTPFTVMLCQPYAPGVKLFANSYLLGTMGHHKETGCMISIVPGLSTPGVRVLQAGIFERQIYVWDASSLPKR
jgi:hypothetical protein